MEKKDFYLSVEQIRTELENNGVETSPYMDFAGEIISKASADFAVKKVAELIEELREDPAKYCDQLGKVATLDDLKYGLLRLLEES